MVTMLSDRDEVLPTLCARTLRRGKSEEEAAEIRLEAFRLANQTVKGLRMLGRAWEAMGRGGEGRRRSFGLEGSRESEAIIG